ncbi:MAG: hypothetical protein AB7Q29_12170 [Vicinamibacterales bacterium]
MIDRAGRTGVRSVAVRVSFLFLVLCLVMSARASGQPAERAIFVDAVATGDVAADAGESIRADVSIPLGAHAEIGDELHFKGGDGRFVNPWARYLVTCRLCPALMHPFVSGRFEMDHHAVDALIGARIDTGHPHWSVVAEEGLLLRDAEHTSAHALSFEVGLSYRIDR